MATAGEIQVRVGGEVRRTINALCNDPFLGGALMCVVPEHLGRGVVRCRILVLPEYDDAYFVAARIERNGGHYRGVG